MACMLAYSNTNTQYHYKLVLYYTGDKESENENNDQPVVLIQCPNLPKGIHSFSVPVEEYAAAIDTARVVYTTYSEA